MFAILDHDWSVELDKVIEQRLEANRFGARRQPERYPVDYKIVGHYDGSIGNDMWYDCTAVRDEELPKLTAEQIYNYFLIPGLHTLARVMVDCGPTRVSRRRDRFQNRSRLAGNMVKIHRGGSIPVRVVIDYDIACQHTRFMFDVIASPLDEDRANAVVEGKTIVRLDASTPFNPAGIVCLNAKGHRIAEDPNI